MLNFNQAIQLDDHNSRALYNRGCACSRNKNYQQACCKADPCGIADFSAVLKHNPYHAEAYINRGMIHQRLGSLQAALDDFRLGVQYLPHQDHKIYKMIQKLRKVLSISEPLIS